MPTPENAFSWASDFSIRANQTVARGFWAKLAADIGTYIDAYNSAVNEAVLSAEPDGDYLVVRYDAYELAIHMDVRTGVLRYWFSTPRIAKIDVKGSEISGRGKVTLDTASSFFTAVGDPPINFGKFQSEGRLWPIHDRLAQYLLQKLLNPSYVDFRFEQS
jgi:hypothetical protein